MSPKDPVSTQKPTTDSNKTAADEIVFADLALPDALQRAINDTGYTTPTPIQAQTIPALLDGRDIIGMAQTGTGKTAAFALPLLAEIEIGTGFPQAIVLAPTRELAMQVAEALKTYAKYLPKLSILPIYGGASYRSQLDGLRQGADIVVGTPGRVIDHLNRKTLKLEKLKTIVLDEADEMLRMGFIEDVENILEHTPESRQVVLFSATMPPAIRKIAHRYQQDPYEVSIASKTTTAPSITQEYWAVDRGKNRKMTALQKFLAIKNHDGVIIFARTKAATEDIAETLARWGYRAAALNGDMNQHQREKTVDSLKSGGLDILVATDVAARGLDVKRLSLVINYDMPQDVETYTHRIGRTGRAGASGAALLFVSGKERYMIRQIENKTRGTLTQINLPTAKEMASQLEAEWSQKLINAQSQGEAFDATVNNLKASTGFDDKQLAQVLANFLFGNTPMDPDFQRKAALEEQQQPRKKNDRASNKQRHENTDRKAQAPRNDRKAGNRDDRSNDRNSSFIESSYQKKHKTNDKSHDKQESGASSKLSLKSKKPKSKAETHNDFEMETYRLAVGADHGVQSKHVVGCIANEAGIEGQYIQNIDIQKDHTLVNLPAGMPKELFMVLRKARVLGHKLDLKAEK